MVESNESVTSLTNFKRHTSDYLRHLKDTGQPIVLTVNGSAEVVVQDAAAYQRLVELAAKPEQSETIAAVRAGLEDADQGRLKPARATLRTLGKKHGIRHSK